MLMLMLMLMLMGMMLAAADVQAANEELAEGLERGDEDAEQARDEEVRDAGSDVEPAALVADHEEEGEGDNVADGGDDHEEGRGRDAEPAVQDAEVHRHDDERDQQLDEQQRPLRERVEDRDQPVHAVEREGRHARYVPCAEEGRVDQEQEEERDARVGQGEGAVGAGVGLGGVLAEGIETSGRRGESRFERFE